MDGYNNFSSPGGYANQPQTQSTGYPNMDSIFNPGGNQNNIPQTNRNFIIVTSLQEALSKSSPYNSKGLYVHQDGEFEFEIFTDSNGRKTYEIFKRVVCTSDKDAMYAPKGEIEELKKKVSKLEELVYAKSKPTDAITNGNAEM